MRKKHRRTYVIEVHADTLIVNNGSVTGNQSDGASAGIFIGSAGAEEQKDNNVYQLTRLFELLDAPRQTRLMEFALELADNQAKE